ncbi:hypothetical protein G6F59_015161 [Rhizopus arrhizus]|nr:hypothetical protein G6F59_015161 [Rhizopus arrhizus]
MRPHLLALALVAALAGCQPADAPTTGSTPAASQQAGDAAVDAAFADLSKRALDTWMQLSPVSATQIGDHRYDSELDDLSAAGQQKTVAAYTALLGELDKIEVAKLGRENQVDAAILRNQLQSEIWNAERDLWPDGTRVRATAGAPEVGHRTHGKAAGDLRPGPREPGPGPRAEDPRRDGGQAEQGHPQHRRYLHHPAHR